MWVDEPRARGGVFGREKLREWDRFVGWVGNIRTRVRERESHRLNQVVEVASRVVRRWRFGARAHRFDLLVEVGGRVGLWWRLRAAATAGDLADANLLELRVKKESNSGIWGEWGVTYGENGYIFEKLELESRRRN